MKTCLCSRKAWGMPTWMITFPLIVIVFVKLFFKILVLTFSKLLAVVQSSSKTLRVFLIPAS